MAYCYPGDEQAGRKNVMRVFYSFKLQYSDAFCF
jgi:hypothetical protein